jgi:hypothetical protein
VDSDVCTMDTQTGTAGACNVVCNHQAITQCTSGDGCCPQMCDHTSDTDCP